MKPADAGGVPIFDPPQLERRWLASFRRKVGETIRDYTVLLEREVAEVSEPRADQRSGHHVAQKMHAEQDARHRNAESAEEQTDGQCRIKQRQRYGHRERR